MSHHKVTLIACLVVLLISITISCSPVDTDENISFTRVDAGLLTTRNLATASATWVDADNDGDSDLYVVNGYNMDEDKMVPNPNYYYQNNGDGTFSPKDNHPLSTGPNRSGNSTWADFDNDGDLDVFIANQGDVNNELYLAGPDNSYKLISSGDIVNDGGKSFSSVWVDMDNDGWIDLHVLNGGVSRQPQADFVYRNKGDGTFEKMQNIALTTDTLVSAGATWGDYDNDGDMDVFIPLLTYTPHPCYENEGNWIFKDASEILALSNAPLTFNPTSEVATWVDIDNDLDLDLFKGTSGGFIDFLYLNNGSGEFERAESGAIGSDGISSTDAAWGDYDNDGDIDLVSAPWGGAAVYYQNNGEGEFKRHGAGELGLKPSFTSGISAEDYDNDGDLDIFISNWHGEGGENERNELYRNDGTNGNWLKVKLEGVKSNRSAIGARLILTTTIDGEAIQQLRYLSGKTNWRNSSSHVQHFGLGNADAASELRIEWPPGQTDLITQDLRANQTILITEGQN